MRRTCWIAILICSALASFAQTAAAPSFDVAAIRLSGTTAGSYLRFLPGGRFSGDSWIKQVIQVAYGVEDYQVTGGPRWLTTDWYAIEAKTEKTDASKEEMTAMLKSLLADRFKLQVRQERKEFDVYDLVVDKGGPKLKPLAKGETFPRCTRDNTVICGITNPAQLARWLTSVVKRPVMDKTGIEGRYAILLDFDTYAYMGGTPPEDYNKPSLAQALKEQGLQIVPAKEAMPMYVVESISKPSPN
jgi:uncharacterized protein (TIGR03435 family)